MEIFHGKFYRYTLMALRYALLWLNKKKIVREMHESDYGYAISSNPSVRRLYKFWFVENGGKFITDPDYILTFGNKQESRTVVLADNNAIQ
jgi:hypothetical protein